MKDISNDIKYLRLIKARLDILMEDRETAIEIRSNELYEFVIKDTQLKQKFPTGKFFNSFLRKQYDIGYLKQIIPNCKVDTLNPNFYQWYFHRAASKSLGSSRKNELVESKLKYYKSGLRIEGKSGLLVRSEQERYILEQLNKCDYLTVEYDSLLSKGGELKYPDFVIKNRMSQKTYYWEHFGVVNSQHYSDGMVDKIKWYKDNGFKIIEERGELIYTVFKDLSSFQKDVQKYIMLILRK